MDREDPDFIVHFFSFCPAALIKLSQAPRGFLESEFVAPVAKQYLKYAQNSLLYPPLDGKHLPKGLYALILVAVCVLLFIIPLIILNDAYS